ncbi:hypothetical protein ACLB6G_04445 [Zhengella sp. ZM62]|uniref:hypothetical protein n=1 Tax=Zhengella sedimenti TaxID=3390035 RepID=UPI003976ADA4
MTLDDELEHSPLREIWNHAEIRRRSELAFLIWKGCGQRVPLALVDVFEGMAVSPDSCREELSGFLWALDALDEDGVNAVSAPATVAPNSLVAVSQAGCQPLGEVGKIATNQNGNTATADIALDHRKNHSFPNVDRVFIEACPVVISPDAPNRSHAPTSAGPCSRTKKNRSSNAPRAISGKNQWRHASAEDKLAESVRVAARNNGMTFSLNLSPKREAAARANNDPTRFLSHYVNREMKQHLGRVLPYSFVLEVSPEGRLHLHGVVVIPGDDAALRKGIKDALMCAGGRIRGKGSSRQLALRKFSDPEGWASYMLEDIVRTRKDLGTGKLVFISEELLRMTREACGAG